MLPPARLLRLLALLQAQPSWPGPELAQRLAITDRTLRRDVDKLRSLGYAVEASAGTAGGYRLAPGAKLPPLAIEEDEALAIALGLSSLAGSAVADLGDAGTRALAKIEQVLPAPLRQRLAHVRRALVVQASDVATAVTPERLAALADACAERHTLTLAYADHAGRTTRRRVEPQRLVFGDGRWYLVAWDLERADWRTFRIDRIGTLEAGPPFAARRPPAEDIGSYVAQGVATAAYRHAAVVLFDAPPERLQPSLEWMHAVVEPLAEGRTRVRTGTQSLDALAVWLACTALPFTVESPPALARHLARLATRLRDAAARSPRTGSVRKSR
ncbi:YafY family transcriptional regulator [Aquincola sp. S2]|uniref:YafY family transcriptional regulator n=1 Tax=Pseudaquabacterium terrae TaxID=2732868 RepID=A0ABX2ED12_9BURK|nr:YafY family protein [Aquabacterium terrae]NRF65893.1 YafY family transcriptional regulator [Aquabacterium terrae]